MSQWLTTAHTELPQTKSRQTLVCLIIQKALLPSAYGIPIPIQRPIAAFHYEITLVALGAKVGANYSASLSYTLSQHT